MYVSIFFDTIKNIFSDFTSLIISQDIHHLHLLKITIDDLEIITIKIKIFLQFNQILYSCIYIYIISLINKRVFVNNIQENLRLLSYMCGKMSIRIFKKIIRACASLLGHIGHIAKKNQGLRWGDHIGPRKYHL